MMGTGCYWLRIVSKDGLFVLVLLNLQVLLQGGSYRYYFFNANRTFKIYAKRGTSLHISYMGVWPP